MKILGISDATDPIIYSPNVAERYHDVDVVLSAGDLPLHYYEFIISSLNKPLFFVFGNHNLEQLNRYVKEREQSFQDLNQYTTYSSALPFSGYSVDGKVMRDKKSGLIIAGLGGSMQYNKGRHQYTESQMRFRIFKLMPKLFWNKIRYGRYLDILITHAPPFGINDEPDICHTGFKALLKFMDRFQPAYLLHGHVHLTDLNAPREAQYNQTKIINIYLNYVLEFENREKAT